MKKVILIFGSVLLVLSMLCGCDDDINEVYENADNYSVGDAEINTEIDNLDISWNSGKINLNYYEGSTIKISENSSEKLKDDKKVHWIVKGNTLTVKFQKSGFASFINNMEKELTVLIPENTQLNDVSVQSGSGDINTKGLTASNIEFETASGNIDVQNISATEMDFETASGRISGDILNANEFSASSSSGKINLSCNSLNESEIESSSGSISLSVMENLGECEIESSSGKVLLTLPENLDFSLSTETASGEFNSDFSLVKTGKMYVHNAGTSNISIETSSGDIDVLKQK